MKNDRKNFESNPSVQWCNEQRKNDHIPLKTTRTNAIGAKLSLWPTTKTDSSIFSRELIVCGVRLALVLRAVEEKKKEKIVISYLGRKTMSFFDTSPRAPARGRVSKNSRFESAVRILLFAVLSKKQVRKGPFLTIANRLKKHRF